MSDAVESMNDGPLETLARAIAAQTDRLPFITPTASAYFGTQPLWFILLADLSPLAGMAGAVAIRRARWGRRRAAPDRGSVGPRRCHAYFLHDRCMPTGEAATTRHAQGRGQPSEARVWPAGARACGRAQGR